MTNHSSFRFLIVWIIPALLFTGCFTSQKKIYNKVLPKADDILIYELPYDLTYLKTLEALQNHPDWDLASTEKEKGTIEVYNMAYFRPNDSDERHITFLVKRRSRNQTSIEISPDDQTVVGGKALLEVIAKDLSQQY